MAASRVAVVTGSNKGIGLAIVKGLAAKDKDLSVILTARSEERGRQAAESLGLPNVRFHQLDVTDKQSVERLRAWVAAQYGGLDVLVNNAGIAWKGDAFDEVVASGTVGCNFWGVVNVWEGLGELVRARRGRVVNISSRAGNLGAVTRPELKRKFVAEDASVEDIKGLMDKFVRDVAQSTWKEEGWPRSTYGVSKIGVSALTRVLARDEAKNGVVMYACCPGWVRTDMGGSQALLTTEQGADTPIFLATSPNKNGELESGGFYAERKLLPFAKGWIGFDM